MPRKFYEEPTDDAAKPKRFCDGLREDLKYCLVNSDCVQKVWCGLKAYVCLLHECILLVVNGSARMLELLIPADSLRAYSHVVISN